MPPTFLQLKSPRCPCKVSPQLLWKNWTGITYLTILLGPSMTAKPRLLWIGQKLPRQLFSVQSATKLTTLAPMFLKRQLKSLRQISLNATVRQKIKKPWSSLNKMHKLTFSKRCNQVKTTNNILGVKSCSPKLTATNNLSCSADWTSKLMRQSCHLANTAISPRVMPVKHQSWPRGITIRPWECISFIRSNLKWRGPNLTYTSLKQRRLHATNRSPKRQRT